MKKQLQKLRLAEYGVALLATTLIIVLLMLTIGLSMTSLGLFDGFIAESQRESQEAYFAAQAGIKDALIKIARDKEFSSAGYYIPSDPSNCALNSSSVCTRLIVEKDIASSCSQVISAGQDCIIATGTLNTKTRTVETILNVNNSNGKITIVSQKEI